MILMIYINDSTIFILIYPCYISILLYRLYSTILCILLSCCFIYPGIFIPAYILWWYIGTNIYTLYICLSYLCFHLALAFSSPYLLCLLCCFTSIWYTYLCSLPCWLWCFPVYEKYIPFTLWESVALALNAHEIHKVYTFYIPF